MRAEIGTDDQSDASRSQALQGAGDETDMAWRSETAPNSAVIQVVDDDGGVDIISVGIGSGKARRASSKTGAKWNAMTVHAGDGSNRVPHSRSNALPVRSAQTRGPTNIGNTCFLNDTLHCLVGVWELGEARAQQPRLRWSLESRLLECISQLQSRLSPHYILRPLLDTLPRIADEFHTGQQADAHEFLVCLLGKMDQGGLREFFYGPNGANMLNLPPQPCSTGGNCTSVFGS
jgi:hypothetical protein